MKNIKKYLAGLAGVLVLGTSSLASANFLPFTVQEGAIAGTPDNLIEDAGKFTGSYQEIITINNDFTLDFFGVANWAGFDDTQGAPLSAFLNSPEAGFGYRVYSIFSGSGSFNPGTGVFTIASAEFSWAADPNSDTVFFGGDLDAYVSANTAANAIALPPISDATSDDELLGGSGSLFFGVGQGFTADGLNGSFRAIWNSIELTALGESYFVEPRPFYTTVEATGDVDQDTFQPGSFAVTGDVSAEFVDIPEPGTLALMGLALTMLGLIGIRRRQQG